MRHAHEEVANQLRDGLTYRADGDLEDSINAGADLLHEDVGATLLRSRLLLLLLNGRLDRLALCVELLRHLVLLRHNRCPILLVVGIVDEHVVLLGVDDGLYELAGMVALPLETLADNIHDLGSKGRDSHEDTLDDGGSESLELCVAVLDELKGGVA